MSDASPVSGFQKPTSLLDELEARQDALLAQLDELNERIEGAITAGQLQLRLTCAEPLQPAAA